MSSSTSGAWSTRSTATWAGFTSSKWISNGWSMIFSETRRPSRIKSGTGFFGIML
jgi:hypothetical protein